MKIKKVIIEVKPLKEVLYEFAEVYGKVKNGESVEPKRGVSFPNIELYRKTFSNKRMQLLKIIKKNKPGSIYELAKILDRDYKNVFEDVKHFRFLGLISKKELKVTFDKLVMEIQV